MTIGRLQHAITDDQAERVRLACYQAISRHLANYTYPLGATLSIGWPHKEGEIINISSRTGESVERFIERYKHRGITHIFITIPSKANTQ